MPRWGGWLRQISASWGGSVLRNGRSSYTALLPGGRVAGRWGETWGWFQTVRQLTNYAISLRLKASREQRIAGPITFSLWGAMLTLVPRRGHVNSRENMATAEYRRGHGTLHCEKVIGPATNRDSIAVFSAIFTLAEVRPYDFRTSANFGQFSRSNTRGTAHAACCFRRFRRRV